MIKTLTYRIRDIVPYINWIYFFHAWSFPPRFASVSQIHACTACRAGWISSFPQSEQERAKEALRLYNDAEQMLTSLDADYFTRARFGIFNAYSDGDDLVFTDPDRVDASSLRLPLLRQQNATKPCLCLADFVRPFSADNPDKAGIFAAAADSAIEHLYETPTAADDYKHLLAQTLADRLAEAAAEKMHEEVRKKYWGYAPDEQLSFDDLFLEKFVGIRPAVGYPSLPDQSINFELDSFLDFSAVGIQLTENGAMRPHAAVSGLLLAHPEAHHFAIGKIGEDQLKSYAERRNMNIETMRKFLAANL